MGKTERCDRERYGARYAMIWKASGCYRWRGLWQEWGVNRRGEKLNEDQSNKRRRMWRGKSRRDVDGWDAVARDAPPEADACPHLLFPHGRA